MEENKNKEASTEEVLIEKEPTVTEEEKNKKEEKAKKKKKDTFEEDLEKVSEELQSIKDKYYRSLAEAENFKKRMQEDLKKERTYGSYSLADKLIDSVEIFDQALNVPTEDPNFKNFLYGFRMIKDMIMNSLTQEGVSVVETSVGDVFDPLTEHAMDTEYDETKPENTILKVVKKGYKFKDRLLRPAMVIINIKPKASEETENNEIEEESKERVN